MNPFLLTTAYFPPIAYFSCLKKAEVTYIEQYENFGKQSYRNRCEIMTANGVIALTVPVAKANSKTLIKDLKIVYPTPWQKLHFRGIESAYKNSPYYEYYIDDLMPFFEKQETYLFDHNLAILTTILDFISRSGTSITGICVTLSTPKLPIDNPVVIISRNLTARLSATVFHLPRI